MGSQEPHRLPFSSEGVSRRNRRTQHSGVTDIRQHDMWSFMPPPTDYFGDLNMVNQVSRQPRASRRSWNIASGSLSMLPVYYFASAGWRPRGLRSGQLCTTSGSFDVSVGCQIGGSQFTLSGLEVAFRACCSLGLDPIHCEIKRTFVDTHPRTSSSSI